MLASAALSQAFQAPLRLECRHRRYTLKFIQKTRGLMSSNPGRRSRGRSVIVPRPKINPGQNAGAGQAHPHRRIGQQIRNAEQGNPPKQRRGRTLLFAIDKKPQANPAPKQGGDQPACIQVKR